MEYIQNYTEGKSVCILGFGREGKSTYNILKKYCTPSEIAICDLYNVDREANNLPDDVKLICGESYQESLDDFDMVFKSPGIVLNKQPKELKCLITSETQVFFEVYREQIIGITGTKGKSTVSSLIYHILKENGKDCQLAGNIGIPVFDIAEGMTEDTLVVCELSCHQLEYMTVSPACAVFLNLFEEHLDHYGTMENYRKAKKNIYIHQQDGDCLLIESTIAPRLSNAYVYSISAEDSKADIYVSNGIVDNNNSGDTYIIPTEKIKLLGIHNHYNIAVAHFITAPFVNFKEFESALSSFNPLAHRLEFVGNVKGIRWYDDSISTACATAIEAVKSVPDAKTILIGGMDRGIDYTTLVDYFKDCDINVICMEASGKRVYEMIQSADYADLSRVHLVEHLEDAVKLAAEITPEGMSCVLSPAAASYGIFKNFEERGDVFRELVRNLK
ncbi:MAG: UDP-N-acetylmuramoyl-L-alanine--D-glutamate ligase [Ruminococcus sp.]|nr:UDP-N-acetylmuramoyl-L-alanine--D-glutamate ligase [Ruminococcus sp.]